MRSQELIISLIDFLLDKYSTNNVASTANDNDFDFFNEPLPTSNKHYNKLSSSLENKSQNRQSQYIEELPSNFNDFDFDRF